MGHLLHRIEGHLRRSGMPPTTFGRHAANDPCLVKDLRLGREPGAALIDRIDRYLTERGA